MVCIYCSGKTAVTNSRPQKRLRQTWRRRQCESCGAIFSTIERADLAASMRVRLNDGSLQPFERDRLFVSIVTALGHRRDAVTAGTALTSTITAKVLKTAQNACVTRQAIVEAVGEALAAFDSAASVHYRAYHQ